MMINGYSADLHLHTNFSDGTYTPQQLVNNAKNLGFNAISITDHDIVDGIPIAQQEADRLDVELIPGVELTIEWGESELHLLGYYIDWDKKWFKNLLKDICRVRLERMKKMVFKLNKLGVDLKLEEVLTTNEKGAIGRLHLANILFKKNVVNSTQEAFKKYISNSGPCYVEKYKLSPKEAIDVILDIKGIPVIAHPGMSIDEKGISKLVEFGLEGIEVYHPGHNQNQIEKYKKIADDYGLVITGGSDCHGDAKSKVFLGSIRINKEVVDSLKDRKKVISHE